MGMEASFWYSDLQKCLKALLLVGWGTMVLICHVLSSFPSLSPDGAGAGEVCHLTELCRSLQLVLILPPVSPGSQRQNSESVALPTPLISALWHLWHQTCLSCSKIPAEHGREIQSSCRNVREHLAATALPLRAWHCLAQRLVFLRAHICLATEYSDLEIVSGVALVTYIHRMFAAAAGSKWDTNNCTKTAVKVTGSLAGIVLWESERCW